MGIEKRLGCGSRKRKKLHSMSSDDESTLATSSDNESSIGHHSTAPPSSSTARPSRQPNRPTKRRTVECKIFGVKLLASAFGAFRVDGNMEKMEVDVDERDVIAMDPAGFPACTSVSRISVYFLHRVAYLISCSVSLVRSRIRLTTPPTPVSRDALPSQSSSYLTSTTPGWSSPRSRRTQQDNT